GASSWAIAIRTLPTSPSIAHHVSRGNWASSIAFLLLASRMATHGPKVFIRLAVHANWLRTTHDSSVSAIVTSSYELKVAFSCSGTNLTAHALTCSLGWLRSFTSVSSSSPSDW